DGVVERVAEDVENSVRRQKLGSDGHGLDPSGFAARVRVSGDVDAPGGGVLSGRSVAKLEDHAQIFWRFRPGGLNVCPSIAVSYESGRSHVWARVIGDVAVTPILQGFGATAVPPGTPGDHVMVNSGIAPLHEMVTAWSHRLNADAPRPYSCPCLLRRSSLWYCPARAKAAGFHA